MSMSLLMRKLSCRTNITPKNNMQNPIGAISE